MNGKKMIRYFAAAAAAAMTLLLAAAPAMAEEYITIYCGIEVPASEFVFPMSSSRTYSKSEFDDMFAGNARQRYFKSQVFINEIFARYGYNFSEIRRAPGKAVYNRYIGTYWYQEAMDSCPSQSMETLMYDCMSYTEVFNIELVNEWQKDVYVEAYDGTDERTITIYNGTEVPYYAFDYPDNSSRKYTKAEFDDIFAGDAKDRYFKSQVFINEIFVRYGYDFSEVMRAPGESVYYKYIDQSWYRQAIRDCPSQNMDTLMNNYMNSTELYNISLVNEWQKEVYVEPYSYSEVEWINGPSKAE